MQVLMTGATGTLGDSPSARACDRQQHEGYRVSSTIGVYGDRRRPTSSDEVVAVREDLPLRSADIYGFSKVVGEEKGRFYRRKQGILSVALRYGMLVPQPFFRYGGRCLRRGCRTCGPGRPRGYPQAD